MAKTSRSYIALLVDRTGSMSMMQVEAQTAVRKFIQDQKEVPGKARLMLADFDSADPFREVYDGKIADAPEYSLEPRGGTPLYDAIAKTIASTSLHIKQRTAEGKKAYDHTFVVIVTDGQENSSREFNAESVKKLIKEREAEGWEFIFLATSLEAFNASTIFAGTRMHDHNTVKGDGTAQTYSNAHSFTSSNIARTRGGEKAVAYAGDMTED